MKKIFLSLILILFFSFSFYSCKNVVDLSNVEYPKPVYSDSQKQELVNYTNSIKDNPNDAKVYFNRANLEKSCVIS